ncbi:MULTISPECIES: c-type cytochrome biogenesis protein CcsB [unclassified Rothia (in: high G+C Gram-positive bacteria)]|uniref:c-type cytochrome biogenesis protein CcsB n=1 Tax=unclassified Rothia (in: high G+C Gram-positive bacteria) TaxID=2689056 RepID=UPI001EF65ABA|nr:MULTISPECIES: c-type cytochrome biogenesis protein CcsB [unclassified Rothia (in: high G+C Gram-positive bacteria)]
MEINQTLAQWSDILMVVAAFAYTLAFVAFAWDLAVNSRGSQTAEQEPELVAAGNAPKVARVSGVEQGTGARGAGYRGKDAQKLKHHVADSEMRYTGERRPAARVAVALMTLAALIHAGGVLSRAFAANRVPWGNMYEFLTTGAFLVSVIFLGVLIFRDLRFVGTLVAGLTTLMMTVAAVVYPTPVGHLIPALRTYWLVIHVSIAVLASAIFTLTFAMAILQLIQDRRERQILETGQTGWAFMRLVPSAQALENFSFRLNAVGFVMWTFTVAAGAIWAEVAWGRYWGWDTKEVWSFIIWVVYAAYLHARGTRGWTGNPSAWLSIAGYLCVIFNFTIVNTFFDGLHSYSGL